MQTLITFEVKLHKIKICIFIMLAFIQKFEVILYFMKFFNLHNGSIRGNFYKNRSINECPGKKKKKGGLTKSRCRRSYVLNKVKYTKLFCFLICNVCFVIIIKV